VVIVRPGSGGSDHGDNNDRGDRDDDRPRPPWRDLDNLRDRRPQPRPTITRQPRPLPQTLPATRSSSVMAEMVQRARSDRDKRRKPTP
jgi:hypothetical protein